MSKLRKIDSDVPIAELEYIGLPLRIINALEESKYKLIYIKDLLAVSEAEISKIDNLGSSGVKLIYEVLKNFKNLDKEKEKWKV